MTTETRKRKLTPLSHKAAYDLKEAKKGFGWFRRWLRPELFRRAVMKIYFANARDYRRSKKLAAALARLEKVEPTALPIADTMIDGDWRPFRVERGLTASMRGEIGGGRFSGNVTSNLLDSSSVLLLENSSGETMRALIPSPATATEMLTRAIERWRKHGGFVHDHYADYSDQDRDSHVSRVIHNFAMSGGWTQALVHPEVIDAIDASCRKPEELRPVIRVQGSLIKKGVALATAIAVNDDQRVFVPTGFFQALTGAVRTVLPREDEPRLLIV